MHRTKRMAVLVAAMLTVGATAAVAAGKTPLLLGPGAMTSRTTYEAYYDHHKDTYLITDVSSKAQARALGVNYSAELAHLKGLPAQYFVEGRAAAGQLSVFGTEPRETDYNPLWEEFYVTWKPGVKPVLLGQDDQIEALAKKGKLTITDAHIVLNAPIVKVGK
jgi:phage tail sheath protein FI